MLRRVRDAVLLNVVVANVYHLAVLAVRAYGVIEARSRPGR